GRIPDRVRATGLRAGVLGTRAAAAQILTRFSTAPLSTTQRNLALFALALGGFAIGITEFATMGLLPGMAQELLSGYQENPQQVIAQAGTLITVYALGVVAGAP